MMSAMFFDSSALQHCYVGGEFTSRVRSAITRSNGEAFIAEWTVLEMASAFGNRCRQGKLGVEAFDEFDLRFLQDLKTKRLRVRPARRVDLERARHLLRFAGVVKSRKLKSGDALIASSCLDLAQERKSRLPFFMGDWGLYSVLCDLKSFRTALKLIFLGNPKGAVGTDVT